jgi:geranylgeranyl pyrophosphate synthase
MMKSVIMRNGYKPTDIDQLVSNIRSSGAIENAAEEARQFVERGLGWLGKLPDGPEKEALADLANYIIDRDL